ncbi:saccharopine dehydrogenase family protein [Couchioplanes caeruleus]|uniref:Saccharopine dehydrogenase n=2 Tax=Couchioplanes caeruleus TaxID=56438 RepID=A0A1K0FBV5_9ACTN|nr:saccharopine dehydrogenase family protein [Couchioplanes caeruleus]OJF10309.1 saccharopine dehydrogenase [Couchioplanes caeruleus subsp. caeruleus]ROP30042.1 saccharopine dehydrogenase-like protein [Couchioplanes caeruleus]
MTNPLAARGVVHWVGAGRSSGAGIVTLTEHAAVTLWARRPERAQGLADRLKLDGRVGVRPLGELAETVRPGDVVVSMLPATEHAGLLRLCLDRGAHFANTSYLSDDIAAAAGQLAAAGLVAVVEAGLDPGIDHLMAHRLVADGRRAMGDDAVADFTSYCGGLPAVPNEFRYRFSWAPRGVLRALLSEARFIDGGEVRTVARPWQAITPVTIGGERFEGYPNRDSTTAIRQYALPGGWRLDRFIRGTLRLDGWSAAWAQVFRELTEADDARVDALADELAARYPATAQDQDRVVLHTGLSLRTPDGRSWTGSYHLDVEGDASGSAMARCVSLTLAAAVREILDGQVTPGLHQAASEPDRVARWWRYLAEAGLTIHHTSAQE